MKKANEIFIEHTNKLINTKTHRSIGDLYTIDGVLDEKDYLSMKRIFDEVYDKKYQKFGEMIDWSDWLVNGVFPERLYKENDGDLMKLLSDKRLYHKPSFTAKQSTHSMFGRMCRPRKTIVKYGNFNGYMDLLIYRLKDEKLRLYPMYYFDVESPTWIIEDIAKNPNQIKTGRTAVSCIVNMMFRWDSAKKCIVLTVIVRHNQWSHWFGDVYGSIRMLNCIEKECGFSNGYVNIVLLSSTLDDTSIARKIVNQYKEKIYEKK